MPITNSNPGTFRHFQCYYKDSAPTSQTLAAMKTHFVGAANQCKLLSPPDVSTSPNQSPYVLSGEGTQREVSGAESTTPLVLNIPASLPDSNDKGQTVAALAVGTAVYLFMYVNTGTTDSPSDYGTYIAGQVANVSDVYGDDGTPNSMNITVQVNSRLRVR